MPTTDVAPHMHEIPPLTDQTANLDTQVLEALRHLEETQSRLDTYLASHAEHKDASAETAPHTTWQNIGQTFENISNGIGQFFRHLFGISDPVVETNDPQVQQIAKRLDLQVDELKQLQAVRHASHEAGSRFSTVHKDTQTSPDYDRQVKELHQNMVPMREMLHHLTTRIHEASSANGRHIHPEHSSLLHHPLELRAGPVEAHGIREEARPPIESRSLPEKVPSEQIAETTPNSISDALGGTPVAETGTVRQSEAVAAGTVAEPNAISDALGTDAQTATSIDKAEPVATASTETSAPLEASAAVDNASNSINQTFLDGASPSAPTVAASSAAPSAPIVMASASPAVPSMVTGAAPVPAAPEHVASVHPVTSIPLVAESVVPHPASAPHESVRVASAHMDSHSVHHTDTVMPMSVHASGIVTERTADTVRAIESAADQQKQMQHTVDRMTGKAVGANDGSIDKAAKIEEDVVDGADAVKDLTSGHIHNVKDAVNDVQNISHGVDAIKNLFGGL